MDESLRASPANGLHRLVLAAAAAFCTYFCMYAFRKPLTAGTFEGQEVFGVGLKTALIVSQLAGYMLSKFIGIRVVSELRSEHRAAGILTLILTAELALVGFAYAPLPWKLPLIFLNGLPLGMVFGLVLAYLEGRQQTEALSAALCASFIMSSGVVKSTGRWLIESQGISEFEMPMLTGAIFLPPLLVSVWALQKTPPPDALDRALRNERNAIDRDQRRTFLSAYFPGLALLVLVYMSLTVVRTIRDDFSVEIWRDLQVSETPAVFALSETLVALLVTGLCALMIWVRANLPALRLAVGLMCAAFALVIVLTLLQTTGKVSPFVFMVAGGVGLYLPYVAFHTTIFERLIAASRYPANLGFLMYVADSLGYLGYAAVIGARLGLPSPVETLPFFRATLLFTSMGCIVALLGAMVYFQRVLAREVPLVAPIAVAAD